MELSFRKLMAVCPYHRVTLALIIVTTWICISHVEALSKPEDSTGKTLCRFRNLEYVPGEVWYPSAAPPANAVNGHCIRCACLVNGRLNCTKEACPTDCPNPSEDKKGMHPCCKYCADEATLTSAPDSQTSSAAGDSSSSFLPVSRSSNNQLNFPKLSLGGREGNLNGPKTSNGNNSPFAMLGGGMMDSNEDIDEEDEDILGNENSDYVSCLHQGKIYRDGDSFTANVTGLPIATPDQCMQCQCQGGMVLCAMKACSSFKCSGPSSPLVSGKSLTTRSTSTFPSTSTSTFSSRSSTTFSSTSTSTDSTTTGAVVGETCCQRCAASLAKNPKFVPQKPPEDRVNIMRRPIVPTNVNVGQRLGYPSSFGTNKQASNTNGNGHSHKGQGISSGSPPFNFNSQQQVESSVSFRDGSTVNTIVKETDGGTTLTKKVPEDCISSGRFYMHDATWHPVIGPLGPMECVICKCNNGQIECNRLKCPHKRELSCSKPVKVEGHCCPICTADKEQIVVPEGSSMCVSAKQDLTAYKSQGFGSNGTEFIEFAFLKPVKTTAALTTDIQVELHEWTLNNGDINAFTTDYLSTAQFDTLRNRQAFILLGATNEKNVEKFTRREKKLERRCTSRCSMRITSLERSLRLHRVVARSQCMFHERSITSP